MPAQRKAWIPQMAAVLILGQFARPLSAQTTQNTTISAVNYLLGSLNDAVRARRMIAALSVTGDKDLAPFFTALASSADKERRLAAIDTLIDLVGADAAPALLERLQKDPAMDVRSEALLGLLKLKAVSAEQLLEAIQIPDERVQCLAARALVLKGQGAKAAGTLKKLAASRSLATSSMSRMSLLGLGQTEHLPAVRAVLTDANTSPIILGLLLDQVSEEKVFAAIEPARAVAKSSLLAPVKMQAHKCVAELSNDPPGALREAIISSGEPVLCVLLLRVLADRDDSQAQLKVLSAGTDVAAALARMELARKDGGEPAAKAVAEAMALEHPIVVDYVLDRAKKDVADRGQKADFYTASLLKYIQSVPPNPKQMEEEHRRAAEAATLLIDLGTPAALEGMKGILAGRYSAVTRSAAVGLLKSGNRATCDLARPLLKSPYNELATDGALALGRFGDPGASDFLCDIVARPDRHRVELLAMASWYLVKIAGQTKTVADAMAKAVK